MASERPKDKDNGLRRFLEDFRSWSERRSWQDRRSGQRRTPTKGIDSERRTGGDRRSDERRVRLADRRQPTPEFFTQTEAKQICAMILDSDRNAQCPRCGGDLIIGPPGARGDQAARSVHCSECRHHAVVTDVPDVLDNLYRN